jgi:acetoin:2,6-dichlorophenolindophenol oxidoreductase subunit alpha
MQRLEAFRRMLRMRLFEERCVELSVGGQFPGITPVYIGQEATGVALGLALEPADLVFTTHRGHGHLLGRGAELAPLMAELFGKAAGYCQGKAGSFHVSSAKHGVPSASAIVGASVPVAVGAAMALGRRGQPGVAVACHGDRSLSEGATMEAINLAALWQAPVIFLCENNDALPYNPRENSQLATDSLIDLARPYDVAASAVDGSDFEGVSQALREAVDRARQGGGPAFLEVRTFGWPGQSGPRYRLPEALRTTVRLAWDDAVQDEFSEWRQHDPVLHLARELLAQGQADREGLETMQAGVLTEVEAAVQFAQDSPDPEPAAAFQHVFA